MSLTHLSAEACLTLLMRSFNWLTNQRTASRSCDHSQPIRGQYTGSSSWDNFISQLNRRDFLSTFQWKLRNFWWKPCNQIRWWYFNIFASLIHYMRLFSCRMLSLTLHLDQGVAWLAEEEGVVVIFGKSCPISRSNDHSPSVQVTWLLLTNQKPVSRSSDHTRPIRGRQLAACDNY